MAELLLYPPTPSFPPELEREIFELAASWYPSTITSLLRVCHRAHYWIEPLLYTVLFLEDPPSVGAIHKRLEAKPSLRRPITHFLWDILDFRPDRWETAMDILRGGRSTPEVAIKALTASAADYIRFSKAIHKVSPQRLTLALPWWAGGDTLAFFQPVYQTTTHLTLFQSKFNPDVDWAYLATLPALTHLALTAEISKVILPALLKECLKLQVVISIGLTAAESHARVEAFFLTTPDPRVVLTNLPDFFEEWKRTARCGYDLWHRAEEFVARKRRGEIEASSYLLDDIIPRVCV
ncbi:hypothetical protein C8R46DRAFT_1108606 [Mycena filopes]|nr:hypothetical protein C8R46DRAFT_1108606 [Mycena filopes]